jgi:predicted RNase H-like HicB family nuclease
MQWPPSTSFSVFREGSHVNKDLDYYRRQPYGRSFEIRTEGNERYLLFRIKEIPEIAGDGLTKDEALRNLRDAFDDYITWALGEGLEITAPSRVVAPQGRTVLGDRHGHVVTPATAPPAAHTAGPDTRRLTPIAA